MLDKLLRIQQAEKLDDAKMATKLGISRSLWSLIRRGKLELSDSVALTAAGVWPSLTRDLIKRAESAADSLTDSTDSAVASTEAV